MARKKGAEGSSKSGTATGFQTKPQPEIPLPTSFDALKKTIEGQLSKQKKGGEDAKARKSLKQRPIETRSAVKHSERPRGKKRDSNGNVLATSANAVALNDKDDDSSEDNFEKEVRALGGGREDIELLADIQSDSELEGAAPAEPNAAKGKSNGLDKGMANILKEIALAQGNEQQTEEPLDDDSDHVEVQQDSPIESQKKFKGGLLCEPRPDWYAPVASLSNVESEGKSSKSGPALSSLKEYAEELLLQESDLFAKQNRSGSSHRFYNTVVTSGTLSDQISALTLTVQESPIHNRKALETLFSMSKKRSRTQAIDVLRALKDLMAQGTLLPESRRLFSFLTQTALVQAAKSLKSWRKGEVLPKGITEQHLIVWAFESWLKEQYFEMLQTLETWCNDEIEFAKSRALSYVYELLKERPEQEANLLRLLINKLGDPVKKIASQASYLLMQLLTVHPAMKRIVVSAIETDFMFRPGQSLHGKYYAAVTLNQTALKADEDEVAQKLLSIYFGLFSSLLKTNPTENPEEVPKSMSRGQRQRQKKTGESGEAQIDELREKLTSALLTGVNRAYPYVDPEHKTFDEHIGTLFTIAHSSNFNTSVQAMLLIQQLSASHQSSSDRFYRVLYESLLDPRLIAASKQQMYLNLVHRALKADLNPRRVKAFVKRILQILSLHEPSFICGAFFLVKDLESSFPALAALLDQPEEGDDDEEIFKDVDEDRESAVQTGKPASVQPKSDDTSLKYDGHKRAPEHANADRSCVWEVLPFLAHFHPSVAVSADHYVRHASIPGKPDLTLHTLIHFLDRFVYRNAKLSDGKMRGSSIMQPMASDNTHAVLLNPTIGGIQRLPINSEAFKAKNVDDVAAEDVFFHKYFTALGKESKTVKKGKENAEDDESDDEDAVWKAMLDTAPELERAEVSDEDVEMSDFEAAMQDDSSADGQDEEGSEADVDVEDGIFDDEGEDDEEEEDVVGEGDLSDFAGLDSEIEDSNDDDDAKSAPAKQDQRKRLRKLPLFASVDDYAKMLEDNEGEDLG